MADSKSVQAKAVKPTRAQRRRMAKASKKAQAKTPNAGNSSATTQRKRPNYKGDERGVQTTLDMITPKTMQPAIVQELLLDNNILYGICTSYVATALSRGYLAFATLPDYPYWASVYLVNVLLAYVRGATPKANALPLWVQNLGQALGPKEVACDKGLISYRFVPVAKNEPWVPPPNVSIGSPSYGYEWLVYIQGGGPDVDLFPPAVAPGGYTDADGAQAWASLALFMTDTNRPHTVIVPLRDTTWKNNVSAFAFPSGTEGLGWGTNAGQAFQAGLEVPVHTPLLSVFAGFLTNNVSASRFARFTNMFGGDACFASSAFHTLWHYKQLGSKRNPKFHAVDFLQFGDVCAQWVSALLDLAMEDAAYVSTLSSPALAQCPLTLQEFLLILRNEIMSVYAKSQPSVQSIYPRAPSSGVDNEFVPYICSSTTVGLGTTGVKLPRMIVENVKSLAARMAIYNKLGDGMWFTPVLGQYEADVLNPSDYTYVYKSGETPIETPSFATAPPTIRRRRNSKGKEEWTPEVEPPISFIDGTSGSSYYFINDQTRLKQLTALWNEWVSRLQTYSMKLTTISYDLGVNICCSIGVTRHWQEPLSRFTERTKDVRDPRMEKKRRLTSTPYANRMVIAESSHSKMMSAPYDMIQKMWILPINKATGGSNTAALSGFTREQTIQGETYSVSMASQDSGVYMSNINFSYAQAMVRGTTGASLEIEDFFTQQSLRGGGGLLSSLAAGALGKLFGPTVGSIAGTVAEALPI